MKQIILNLNDTDKNLFITEKIMQGENLASEMVINLSSEFLGYKYKLALQNNDNDPFVTVELIPVENVITYLIQNTVTKEAGILKVELHAYNNTGLLIKTATTSLRVEETIDGTTEIVPESYVPWYITAVEQAEIATTKASEASASADTAKISETNAKTSETNAETSEENALASKQAVDITKGQIDVIKTDIDATYQNFLNNMENMIIDGGTF
jgi:hypothetical protein